MEPSDNNNNRCGRFGQNKDRRFQEVLDALKYWRKKPRWVIQDGLRMPVEIICHFIYIFILLFYVFIYLFILLLWVR